MTLRNGMLTSVDPHIRGVNVDVIRQALLGESGDAEVLAEGGTKRIRVLKGTRLVLKRVKKASSAVRAAGRAKYRRNKSKIKRRRLKHLRTAGFKRFAAKRDKAEQQLNASLEESMLANLLPEGVAGDILLGAMYHFEAFDCEDGYVACEQLAAAWPAMKEDQRQLGLATIIEAALPMVEAYNNAMVESLGNG